MAGNRSTAHWLARIEDAMHRVRLRGGLRRGLVPTVIPFTGYGTTEWVRVLGRVVLRRPGSPPADRFTSVRGWRSFLSIPVSGAHVEVTVDGAATSISSDRGGVLDAAIPAKLAPGWAVVTMSIEGDVVDARVFIVDDAV
ncbi:MAG: ACP synthase, partial [Leifsonia sp.]